MTKAQAAPAASRLIVGITLAVLLAALAGLVVLPVAPALADSACTAWSTAKAEREEGKQWTAVVCAKRKDRDALLEIVCSAGKWNVRYQPVLPDSYNPGDQLKDFDFATSTGTRRLALGFEGMDGAFATDLDPRHPLFEMLMSGAAVEIRSADASVPAQSYTLSGSRKALTSLSNRCGR